MRSLRTSEKELVLLISLEKVSKPSLKSLDSTNPQTDCVQMEEIQDHRYPPQEWSTNKEHSKSKTCKSPLCFKGLQANLGQLKAFLTLANVNVYEPIIRTTLNKNIEHFGLNEQRYVWRKKTLHSSIRTLSHLWNMVVVVSWFGSVLLHLVQDGLPSLMEQWIKNYTSEFWRKMSGHLSENWISRESRKTTTPGTQVILPNNLLKKNKVNVLEWLSQIPDLNPIAILWKELKQAVHRRKPPTSQRWSGSVLRNELKLLQDWDWLGLISRYKKHYLQLLLQKGVRPDTESKDSHTFDTHRYVTLDHFSQ